MRAVTPSPASCCFPSCLLLVLPVLLINAEWPRASTYVLQPWVLQAAEEKAKREEARARLAARASAFQ